MTLYNVTAEIGGFPRPTAEEVERLLTDELTVPFHAVLHVSEHEDGGLAVTMSLESFGPGMAAEMAVDLLKVFRIEAYAVAAMPTEEFDRRNGLTGFLPPPS